MGKKTNSVEAVLSNNDLLIQILTCVPPEPLITFQIVSKQWLSIISDPDFVVTQTRHHLTTHPPSSFSQFSFHTEVMKHGEVLGTETIPISTGNCSNLFRKLDSLKDVRQNAPFKYPHTILHSCNGLILYQDEEDTPFIVYNPTTQKHKQLPEPLGWCGNEPYDMGLGTVLAFDPLKSFHYKIIRFRCFYCLDFVVDIDIFSSESGAWKEIHLQDPPGGVLCDSRMIFWNGAIHWITDPNFHVSFIVDEEKFTWDKITTNSDTLCERVGVGYFGESDNGLLLIKFYSGVDDIVFTVLGMDKNNCWSRKHQVNLKPLVSRYTDMNLLLKDGMKRLNCSVLYIKSDTKNGDFSMIIAIRKKIILYEIRKGYGCTDSKVLRDFPYYILGSYHDMHPFIECLAPVH